uniref:Uncharacterized protein n=1 Tax=Anguilla anguilla TaxID=7936 RepID=A0A0E9TPM7_ANGAN
MLFYTQRVTGTQRTCLSVCPEVQAGQTHKTKKQHG